MVVVPNMNVARKGVVIEPIVNLGCGSDGFSTGRNLNRSLGLPTVNTKVTRTPQMVFMNPIMIIHVHKITDRPPMNLIIVGGYKSIDVKDPKGGHQEPFVITQEVFNHRNGHFMRPNKVAIMYLDFKKDVDPDVHVRVFNSIVKANV
jgi:hypothetical protein